MDIFVELILIIILLVLGNTSPRFLVEFAHSTLGKTIMVATVAAIAFTRGLAGGLLAALIFVLLLHSYQEGMADFNPSKTCTQGTDCSGGVCSSGICMPTTNGGPHDTTSGNTGNSQQLQSQTNRVDNENTLNRGAQEATLAASRQLNDQTNN